jgi:CheY-like chemotaxis protein
MSEQHLPSSSGMKNILIVDDSEVDRLVTSQLILRQRKGVQVDKVPSAVEALTWIQQNRSKVDEGLTILLEILMPEMNGFQFLDAMQCQTNPLKNKINVVMLSTTMDKSDIRKAEQHPCVITLLEKPLRIESLDPYLA